MAASIRLLVCQIPDCSQPICCKASSVLWSSDDVYEGFAAKARKEQATFEGK